jgi:hypothetical protein
MEVVGGLPHRDHSSPENVRKPDFYQKEIRETRMKANFHRSTGYPGFSSGRPTDKDDGAIHNFDCVVHHESLE